jgi:hypothetical protein
MAVDYKIKSLRGINRSTIRTTKLVQIQVCINSSVRNQPERHKNDYSDDDDDDDVYSIENYKMTVGHMEAARTA